MNPDVAAAVDELRRTGVLTEAQAAPLGRVARGELVSVRAELRALLYGGVLTIMSGVGVLVRQNLDRIGPVAIAAGLCLAALLTVLWALREAPPFSWDEVPWPHLAFDYILLLGVLLTGAALAYVEVKFNPLGAAWHHHLLAGSLFAAALAVRGDSRLVAAVALSSFAAWRGIPVSPLDPAFYTAGRLRTNAVVTGLLFLALGLSLLFSRRKPHFEPVATHFGWLLILGAILSGIGRSGGTGIAFSAALFTVGSGLAAGAAWRRRFPLFGLGVVAGYIGLSALVLETRPDDFLVFLWFAFTGAAMLVGLLVAHRRLRWEDED
jgi:hypothetical protein